METGTHHSKSLYMIVKKTCKNKFTALISTANRYSHASPDIMVGERESSLQISKIKLPSLFQITALSQ
jgi:hypothetical protein